MMLSSEPNFGVWVVVWLVMVLIVLYRHWRADWGVGLLLAYVVSLGAIHWFAPALLLLPWYDSGDVYLTAEGTRQSALGIVGIAIGGELVTWLRWTQEGNAGSDEGAAEDQMVPRRLVNLYLVAGVLLYAVARVAGRFPGLSTIIATGSTLIAVGLALKCWNAWQSGRRVRMWLWMVSAGLLPVLTVLAEGFLGYGFAAMLMVLAFMASFRRLTWTGAVAGMLIGYLGLSVYVTYMRDRHDIRDVVWGGGAVQERVARVADTFTQFEWFDPWNLDHLRQISRRLNQNYLVGTAVVYMEEGMVEPAHGETLWNAAIAIVPRSLWPDKPIVGGSGDLVSTYTGLVFAEGTSVGVGQLLECYINFGTTGVVLGFIVLGGFVVLADRSAARHLRRGDSSRFLVWYLPGLCLLQVGGALGEVTGSAAGSLLVAIALNRASAGRRVMALYRPDATVAPSPQPEATR